ncbi:hypothetical protein SAMN04487987_101375 [Algibacter pectinivorans]|uniref:Uncharacterized protein n=1 Tax=Algibacter pectinivorans TaxID=870482 RepID=A0A1I1MM08_9FLAO|nr:hypothetical protein SAMN04487987_101375 [Algibacter pectinivorans]
MLLILGIVITVHDEKEKNKEIVGLNESLDSTRNTLVYIKANGDTLISQLKPILDLAKSKYPNLPINEALDSLNLKINTLDSSFFAAKKTITKLNDKTKKLEKKIKIITSFEFRVTIDELTYFTPLSEKETSTGIQSIIGMFDNNNIIYRFATDYQYSVEQVSNNKLRTTFVYKAEDPNQILGKKIDMLSEMKIFGFNYSNMPEIFGEPGIQKSHLLSCVLYLNGVRIKIFKDYELKNGRIYEGMFTIPISYKFSKIESTFEKYIEEEINLN